MTRDDETGIFGHEVFRRLREDLRSSTPTPRHALIYDALRQLIERGDLQGGAHLPPLSSFSRVLLVGGGTVKAATERLVQHGYLDPRTKHGYKVTSGHAPGRDLAPKAENLGEKQPSTSGADL